jgi:hypothetical protein
VRRRACVRPRPYSEHTHRIEAFLRSAFSRCPAHCARIALVFIAAATSAGLIAQAPALPAQASSSSGPIPEYIEDFFLSEAVRSEEQTELQLTVSGAAYRGRGSSMDGQSADLDIEYGLTDRLQLGFEAPYGIEASPTSEIPLSWSSAEISLLYQFIRSNHPFAMSGAMGVNAPITSRGELSYEPELLAAKAFGTYQIHASVIPEFGGDGNSLEYNVAADHPLAHHFIPTLEINGRRNAGFNSFYVTPGIYKRLPHRFEIGAAVPAVIGRYSSPVGVVFKATWEIGGDKDD